MTVTPKCIKQRTGGKKKLKFTKFVRTFQAFHLNNNNNNQTLILLKKKSTEIEQKKKVELNELKGIPTKIENNTNQRSDQSDRR